MQVMLEYPRFARWYAVLIPNVPLPLMESVSIRPNPKGLSKNEKESYAPMIRMLEALERVGSEDDILMVLPLLGVK